MYEVILNLHSYLAYIVLALLFLTVANAILGLVGNKPFTLTKDFRMGLFTLILSHMQLLIGIVLYFVSPRFQLWGEMGGKVMGDSMARLYLVEHPFINILALVFITIGWSKHKKLMEANRKFKTFAIFYGIGLVLLLSRIPWSQWL
ncbi:hypothetical protein [Sediminicola luteus]|uniref:50S ribosomal protein L27 n=1 Tax=Sediminicola luteus TaxID=319238 RepID=A0A2A4G4D4_9FLAO|nr:hypothetical protein [Sediminicola luteus]PCE62836.1 hypothetical protein B7P33_16280 [Sediminicola luteus]